MNLDEKHCPPVYHRYNGGYAHVTVCKCGAIGLREDNHPANPCKYCGRKLAVQKSARWVKTSKWPWSNKGYWEFAEEQ